MPGLLEEAQKAQNDAIASGKGEDFGKASGAWRALANSLARLAEKGEADWCDVGEAWAKAADDLITKANLETASAANSDIREAARLYGEAAEAYDKCGDRDVKDEEYVDAIGAYTKAAYYYGRVAASEQTVVAYFEGQATQDIVTGDQAARARKRRDAAEKSKGKSEEKRKQAREKFF
jgi:hypothetical protein